MVTERGRLTGELAHASIPDLKDSVGGLRDATALKALVASWLVDVPHGDLERCRVALLDVRDALHTVAGRATDRVVPEYWPDMAEFLGLPDGTAVQVHTRRLARRITHLSRLAWRRAEAVQRRPDPTGQRRPRLEPIAPGVAVSYEEVVLDRGATPGHGPAAAPARGRRGGRAEPAAGPGHGGAAGPRGPAASRPLARRRPAAAGAAAGGRARAARRVGDARRDRGAGADPARVGTGAAAAARLGGAPVHRRPAHGGGLHRGVDADPPGGPARRADGGGAAARHRQGPAHRALRRGRAARPRHRRADRLRRA